MSSQLANPEQHLAEPDTESRKARLIAFYLPQFHPIPENDVWWGKGFTEWTNVAKAEPLFKGHRQPNLPSELGFYDLRLPESRSAQADLAREAGIEGFCYWHYWFAGRRILERPFNEVLESGEPDFPFCLGWANQTWSGIWHGASNKILIEQTYPGAADYERHFYAVLPAFQDRRYIQVRKKPVFVIYRPDEVPDIRQMIELWQSLASRNGLPGVHFVAHILPTDSPSSYVSAGYSATTMMNLFRVSNMNCLNRASRWQEYISGSNSSDTLSPSALTKAVWLKAEKILQQFGTGPAVFDYEEAMLYFLDNVAKETNCYPCLIPNWDNSPRSGNRAFILQNSTPELFRRHVRETLELVMKRPPEDRLVFVKSWNEWAEGNYLEPDAQFGRKYLDVLRSEVLQPAR